MITLDCSLVLNVPVASGNDPSRRNREYIGNPDAAKMGLRFTAELLEKLAQVYGGAVELCREVYFKAIRPAGRPVDFEISLDETEEITTAEAHFFVANELKLVGVEPTNLAPRFVGEFQKAVDYIGDLEEFRSQLRMHVRIAEHFGHKLSFHSASEKFAVFPIIAQETGGRCHIKTSGTSWLEVVACIAGHDPTLYRQMHRKALEHLAKARQFYVVHCDPSRIPPLDAVGDNGLSGYLSQNDSRQMMHITYGFILADQELRGKIYGFLEAGRELYEAKALDLYRRHLRALGR